LIFIAYQAIVPSGRATYLYNFDQANDFIGPLTPKDRVETPSQASQKIIGNPVYFSLRSPRPFETARLTIKYRNSSQLPLIEAGVLLDGQAWRYDMRPIENRSLDQLIDSGDWGLQSDNDLILLQRDETYASISDFLKQLPARDSLALYNYNLPSELKLSDYRASSTTFIWPYQLKGDYQFYTYIKDEVLRFDFNFQDFNYNKDPDPISVTLYDWHDRVQQTIKLSDDGTVGPGNPTAPRPLRLEAKDLPAGVYKVEVKANSDIITTQIITKQQKLSFINRLWLAPRPADITLTSRGGAMTFQTINPASRQTVSLNGEAVDLSVTYKQVSSQTSCQSDCLVKLATGDVIVSLDGVMALEATQLIEPRWPSLTAIDSSSASWKYVLAKYRRPTTSDTWSQAQVDLNLIGAYREADKYSFMLSIPGLSAEDETADYIEIKEIRLELAGKTLWQALQNKLKAWSK